MGKKHFWSDICISSSYIQDLYNGKIYNWVNRKFSIINENGIFGVQSSKFKVIYWKKVQNW
jgi:hypothetical protein